MLLWCHFHHDHAGQWRGKSVCFEDRRRSQAAILKAVLARHAEAKCPSVYCAGTVTAYETDDAGVPVKGSNGKLQARCVVKVPKEDGIPDGMTIDRCGPPPHTPLQSDSQSLNCFHFHVHLELTIRCLSVKNSIQQKF